MNGDDVIWLEKLFKQHRVDQQMYLDDKFNVVNKKLDTRAQDCKECRKCLNEDIESLDEKIEEADKGSTKKVVIGSVSAICVSIVLWTAFGAGAVDYAIGIIKFMF